MGAAAAPIIGQIIVSIVVSKVATEMASKLGMSDSMAGLVGMGAGMYAGAAVPGGIGGPPAGGAEAAAPTVGMDLSEGYGGVDLAINASTPGMAAAPSDAITPSLTVGDAAGPSGGLALGSGQPGPSGMLTEGLGTANLARSAPPVQQAAPVSRPGGSTADRMIQSGTTTPGVDGGGSWWQKLMSPDNTMSLAMAGMSGYGKAGLAKEQMEYPEKVAKADARDWERAGTGGISSMKPTYRSQGGSY